MQVLFYFCIAEAEFAHQLQKKMLILKLQKGYDGDDWLKPVIEGHATLDLTKEEHFDRNIDFLLRVVCTEFELTNIRVQLVHEFPVNSDQDRMAVNIGAISYLPGGKLVIVDRDNKTLKLYSEGGHCLHITENPQETWGITPIFDNNFATCGHDKKVLLWKEDRGVLFKYSKYFSLNWIAEGIHFNEKVFRSSSSS